MWMTYVFKWSNWNGNLAFPILNFYKFVQLFKTYKFAKLSFVIQQILLFSNWKCENELQYYY